MNEAVEALQQGKSKTAITLFKEAITEMDNSKDGYSDYNYLYAHACIMRLSWEKGDIFNADDILTSEYALQADKYAKKCIAILRPSINAGTIAHYTDLGAFQEDVIRTAANAIGWIAYKNEADSDKLIEALDTLNLGCEYASNGNAPDENHLYIFDTKVRLLLKMERTDEAYTLVNEVYEVYSHFDDLDDIKESKQFNEWLDKNVDFTEEDKEFLAKAKQIFNNMPKTVIPDDADKTNSYKTEIIDAEDAIEKYDTPDHFDSETLVIHGNVYIEGDLDDKWIAKQLEKYERDEWEDMENIVINGNLYVTTIDDDEVTIPVTDTIYRRLKLFVTGDVFADYIYSGDSAIDIEGTAVVKYGVEGVYNDGYIHCDDMHTSYMIDSDHDMPVNENEESILIEGGSGDSKFNISISIDWDYIEKPYRLLKKEVWDEDGNFDSNLFFGLLRKNINPFIELD